MARREGQRPWGLWSLLTLDAVTRGLGRKWHYAWVVLVMATLLVTVATGVRISFGVFVAPLVERFNWSVGAVSFGFTMLYIAGVPFALMGGWLADTFGIRRVLVVATLAMALGMLLTATVDHLWELYLYYGVLVGGSTAIFLALVPAAVTRWFHRHVGFAVGVVFTSTGTGPMIVAPVFGWLLASTGWTQSFLLVGIASAVLMGPAAVLMRSYPAEVGRLPYGQARATTGGPSTSPAPHLTLRNVQATWAFWALTATHMLGCMGHAVLLVHVVRMAELRGVPVTLAAGLVAALSATSVATRLVFPILTERWGGRSALALGLLAQGSAIFLFLWADSAWALYAASSVFGLGYGAEMVAFPVINRQYYGTSAPLNSIHSWELAGGFIGMGLGGWLGGVLFDATGSYTASILLAAFASLSTLPFIFTLPARRGESLAASLLKRVRAPAPGGVHADQA